MNLLKSFFGVVKVYTHPTAEKELTYDDALSIHGFIWIAPWSTDVIHRVQYMELDATFEISKPYTLCCPQAVINGLSFASWFYCRPKRKLDTLLNIL